MDGSKRNLSSPEAGLADGVPSPAEAHVKAAEGDHSSSGREAVQGEMSVPTAPDPDAFLWNALELDSPIDGKMQSVSLIGSPSTLLPDDMWNALELASAVDGKMDGVRLIGSSNSQLPDAGGPVVDDRKMDSVSLIERFDSQLLDASVSVVVEEEGRREEPMCEDEDTTDGDDESDKSEANDSENGESSGSDESSSDDSDSSTSTSSEEEEDGSDSSHGVRGGGVGNDEEGEISIWSDEEEEVSRGPIISKNEIEVLPPVPEVKVSLEPHHQTIPVGVISSVLGNRVVVEGTPNHKPLSEGSMLWITETRSPLGIIDEIFGPVKNPYYIVRYNSEKDIPTEINNGTAVSFVMDFANYVLEKDLNKKGYDASGKNDEEISDEAEFSDDEKEAEYRKATRQAKREISEGTEFSNKDRGAEYKNSMRQAKRGTDDRKFGKKENVFSKRNTHVKGAGAQKDMMPHGHHGPGNLVQPVPGQNGHYMMNPSTASLPVCLVGDPSNPSGQQLQQPNAILDHRMLFPQQMNPPAVYQMPMSMQQQGNALWPLGFPPQLLNPILTHGIQHQPIAGMPGLQMNWHPNQQLAHEAYLQLHQKHGFMDNFRMPSQQQLLQMFGTPAMPQMGPSNSSTAGLVPPMVAGQSGAGHAPSMHAEQGIPGLGSPQFNPGSSSGRGRMPRQRGGRSFRRGK